MLLKISAILAGLCVFLGAFAAHVIENKLSTTLISTYKTATHYMQWHTIAIILTILCHKAKLISSSKPAWYFLIGIIGIMYGAMSWQGSQAYNSSAKSARTNPIREIFKLRR